MPDSEGARRVAVHLTEPAITKACREAWEAEARRELIDAACPGLRLRLTPPSRKVKEGQPELGTVL